MGISTATALTDFMASELETCAAAFFRIKGKDVVTDKEFTMSMALDLRWMSVDEAKVFANKLIAAGILTRSNGYLKPAIDLTAVQVPIAYRPSDTLRSGLSGTVEKPAPAANNAPTEDLFSTMMEMAVGLGIQKGKFVSECNSAKKKLGVDIVVAGLLILRDSGADIEKLKDRVYTQVLGN